MKKFLIKTLGCRTNQAESALMAEILSCRGFIETNKITEADFFILNSCSVTHTADTKNLACLRRAKRENPSVKIVVTGCMAQLEKDNLIKNKTADYVIGNYEKNDIAEILSQENNRLCVSDIFSHDSFRCDKLCLPRRTRAFVKIQDGCNNRCSYCAIPFARGKNRSNSIENIIEQINFYASKNYFETVLTGIHIGQWGYDFIPEKSLKNLLCEVEKTNIKRYRLGSLNPAELSFDFIDFLSASSKFCPHFHLSLQSMCDKTLKNMNRNYKAEQVFSIVDYIHSKFKNVFIGSDIITGFSGETETDFETTRQNLSKLNLTKIHVFPYSKRKNTSAYTMPDKTSDTIKKERAGIIQKISDDKLKTFLKNNINTQNEVIIEKNRDKKTKLLKGVTKNYINVLIDSDDKYKNSIQKVKLISLTEDSTGMNAEII